MPRFARAHLPTQANLEQLRERAVAFAQHSPRAAATWKQWRMAREHVEWQARFRGQRHSRFLVPRRVVYVAPERIVAIARGDFAPSDHSCPTEISGDWDLHLTPADNDDFYDDLRLVADGGSWKETRVYRRALTAIADEGLWNGEYFSAEEVDEYFCAPYDNLLASMRRYGYLAQRDLAAAIPRWYRPLHADEVTLAIGRDGALFVREGRHRVACAAVLGIPAIPARVFFRHSDWMATRELAEAYAQQLGGMAPQPTLHPDLDNIPAPPSCDAVLAATCAALRSAGGALVDLTPSWGYYCRRLEDIGFPSTALASNGESDEFLHALRVTQAATFATARAHDAAAHPAFAVGVALDPAYLGLGAERRLLDLLSTVALDELVLAVPAASAEAWDLAAVARAGHFTTRVELPAPAGATRLHHFVR
ncbi:MAG: hypothetical protein R2826_02355 [Thermoleophilia bacterium]